jgi:amicyanin
MCEKFATMNAKRGHMKNTKKLLLGAAVAATLLIVAFAVSATGNNTAESDLVSPASNGSAATNSEPSSTTSNQAPAGNDTSVSSPASIQIKDYAFGPAILTIKVGDTVTWTNQDAARHDVVMENGAAEGPNSELLAQGESYSYTFTKEGVYDYYCSPHPYMKAKVIVEK